MQCPNKELHTCYKMALQVLGISAVPRVKPADHITRYCARLKIKDYGVQSAAKHVACAVQRENLLMGKNPISVACACIYLVGQLSDPDYAQGLAHFLGNMLLLGTEKHVSPPSFTPLNRELRRRLTTARRQHEPLTLRG